MTAAFKRVAASLVSLAGPLVSLGEQVEAPEPSKEKPSAPHQLRFTGTDNPRHARAITVLLRHPTSRKELDSVAGASNSPDLIAELRRRGLDVPCQRICAFDRDGRKCHPGVYSLTSQDRQRIYAWLSKRDKGGACG